MADCNHDCSSCAQDCNERAGEQDFSAKLNHLSRVSKVIAVMSGKGGVGKSLVTSLLAVGASKRGLKTAVLDADMTGPSIPQAFHVHEKAQNTGEFLLPASTKGGIELMSLNLLLEHETDPVVWRGPMIAGAVKQFWTDVVWRDIDVMFIDMPPGTGDVPLTVFQSLPIDGIVAVTSPQGLVSMIVEKAVNMAKLMERELVGLVENFSYFECPNCKTRHAVFGESDLDKVAERFGIDCVAKLPLSPDLARAADEGRIEECDPALLDALLTKIESL